jgi:hypothetical protein
MFVRDLVTPIRLIQDLFPRAEGRSKRNVIIGGRCRNSHRRSGAPTAPTDEVMGRARPTVYNHEIGEAIPLDVLMLSVRHTETSS